MTDTNKINAWAFPFNSAGDASKEITDPQFYYDALAKAKNGFYPMGDNGLWHGGVHFDSGTAAALDQSSVRCIADGEVIAYRIDNQYPESEYISGVPLIKRAPFSTGFVLVKHRLELPPVPAATPATPAAPAAPAEALTFYSLYMHLLDWKGYQAPGAPLPPPFLAETSYLVSERATDPIVGLRVRKLASGGSTEVLAMLPKGCKVTLGAADISDPSWKQLASIVEGAAVPALPSGVIGWVYAPELTGGTVAGVATDTEPALTLSHQGLNVRKEGKLTGTIIGVLPRGAKVKLGAESTVDSNYYKLLEVLDYKGVPALPNGADGKPLGYVYLSKLDAIPGEPKAKEAVYPLPTAYPIKAGELIGHLGQYQNHDDSTPKALLHLEVFSCEDVPAFIAKSRARASSLPATQKTLLKIHPDTKLITHAEGMSATNPPKVSDPGQTIGVTRIIPLAVLNSLPADRKIQTSTPMAGGPPVITQWWRLNDEFADKDGNLISGWLADIIPTHHSPWEWEGFDFISETACAADQFACHLDAQRLLSEVGQADYQAQINTADNGPVKTRLYDIIDGADGSVRDDKLSTTEIRAALGKPWHAQSISRLITHYESEWFWKATKWDELDKLMEHTPADPNPNWVSEKKRIQTLSWWSEINLNPDGKAWHLNAAALIGNFSSKGCVCLDDLTKAQLKAIAPGASTANVDRYISPINEMFRTFGIESCISRAHVLAQMLHESGSMNFVTEGLNSDNPLPSYHPYIGRGLIQITWEANYRAYGNYIGESFIGSPHYNKMAAPPHCVTSVGWFWTQFKKLLNHSDSDDFIYITALINGGFNGYDHRLEFLNSAIEQLKIRSCAKLNTAGVYKLEDSEAYNKAKFSFAWGLWSDPGSTSRGKAKNTPDAIAGYSRFLEIYESSQRVRDDNTTTYYASSRKAPQAKDHAERRIEALRSS
ncbi:hypothetical protein [Pseudomonas sp.]|uniref:hypothetical protein n=1 Tax=Pseudomonas sp. TaxID=306 RepID=UPI0027324135|nr:hypothetical protein [Pseudomonas sp.]MDP3817226.1 hypothetical protein [Pseudomonas sp.]